jgi:putative hydrolase of the HAD superfamily
MGINSIRAVIFDVGGVLLRSGERVARRKWETRLGLRDRELSRIIFGSEVSRRAMLGRATEEDVWRQAGITLKLGADQLRELRADFWSDENLDHALVQFLRDLRPRYKTGILSNAFASARQALTNKYKLNDVVDTLVFSGEEKLEKPDPRFYHIVLERLDVLPEQAIFVDDIEENVLAAKRLGMKGVQFKETQQVIEEVKEYLE